MWKGNGANTIRIFPYSAAQLAANDQLKRALASPVCCLPYSHRIDCRQV